MNPSLFFHLLSFFGVAVVLALAPGPDNLFILAQSVSYGRRAGLFVTLGLCSGLCVHTAAVALGVAAFFQNAPFAFRLLCFAGGFYLLYMAWGMIRGAWRMKNTDGAGFDSDAAPALTGGQLYRRGIIMNLCNPKVSVFFLAFLPGYVWSPGHALFPQIILLGGLFIVATLLVFSAIAAGGGFLGALLKRRPRLYSATLLASGLLVGALGLLLLFKSQPERADGEFRTIEEETGGIGRPVVTDGNGL